jgi:putative SOS response-associated peptidase YedK
MCGRTALTTAPEDLREAFGLDETPSLTPHYNVPPSQPVAVVRVLRHEKTRVDGTSPAPPERGRRTDGTSPAPPERGRRTDGTSPAPPERGRRTMETLRWGLIPAWAKDRKIGNKLALARVETAAVTPAFRDALRRRRCLVVVDGFFEWKRAERGKSQPFFVRRDDGAPFALASVWERWVSADGEVVESCAVITQPAQPPVDAVHDRMPLVVEPETWDRWLDPVLTEPVAIESMLATRTPMLVAYPVSPHVNDPRNDDADCLKRQEPAQRTLF